MDGTTLANLLSIIQIFAILGGGGLVAFRLGRTSAKVEAAMKLQAAEISELKGEVKTIGRLMTDVAVQRERLDGHDRRLDVLDSRYDELRHGEGYVFPLMKPTPHP